MFVISKLPLSLELETKAVLKKTTSAGRALAELKSIAKTIPNEAILINTLVLQEAKDSSAVENIITTHDELFKASIFSDMIDTLATKEVQDYADALKNGFKIVQNTGLLTENHIISIQEILEKNKAGFRQQAGTVLKNSKTNEIVYTPPQDNEVIIELMRNLVEYINCNDLEDTDPLVKMAVIHFQFESIHPFYDGNGRTGRIINILYLILQGLLELPILYLSRYIIRNKDEYYKKLQAVRDSNKWEDWILFNLDGIEQISLETIALIQNIKLLMQDYKHRIREKYSNFYSQDLLNNLFKHPYTKIEFLQNDLNITRQTASNYLSTLAEDGFLDKIKLGKSNFYVNVPLYKLFTNQNGM
ncbi:MAG: Fic family protein [Bacteroidetes bacterium]|nr:MAG: Fic family protein [Bacteroidota bacterium]